jgi:cupin 2 domain-containing protein
MLTGNLFSELPDDIPEEIYQTLIQTGNIKIERIVSHGQTSPENFWYDQPQNEWVLLLQGHARIAFADGKEVDLHSGDYLNIPAHIRHRVEYTHEQQISVWLVVFYD